MGFYCENAANYNCHSTSGSEGSTKDDKNLIRAWTKEIQNYKSSSNPKIALLMYILFEVRLVLLLLRIIE